MPADGPEQMEGATPLDAATEAGIVLIDEEGLEAVTIQRLADVMGVPQMTLESYVRTRDELLERIARRALEQVPTAVPDVGPWSERIASAMEALRSLMIEHPGITELIMTRPIPVPALDGFRESMLGVMRDAGFPRKEASDAVAIMMSYTLGFALVERTRSRVQPELEADRLRSLEPSEFPNLTEAAEHYAAHISESAFRIGLDTLVEGLLERHAGEGPPAT